MPGKSWDPNGMGNGKIRLSHIFWNGISAFFFLAGAAFRFKHIFFEAPSIRPSEFLLALQLLLAGIIFIIRQAPSMASWKPLDVILALVGTFSPALFSLEARIEDRSSLGIFLQILGTVLAMAAYVSLGRSFGIIPALRKVKTHGPYRVVRHPIYAAYQFSNLGFLFNHPTFYNALVALLCLLSQVYRIYSEERVLEQDASYADYKERVRWRMLPYVY